MNVLVGCPVLRREWIIDEWMRRADLSCVKAGLDPSYILVGDKRDPTMRLAERRAMELGRTLVIVNVVDQIDDPHVHAWGNHENLHKMVVLRNIMLREVRRLAPDLFLSLDSDILVHEDQVPNLLETIVNQPYDAVGGKVFLVDRDTPSWGSFTREGGLKRYDVSYVMEVQVLMAIKLMMPSAYHIDYAYEKNGEDIGWSLNCAAAGLRLGFDGRITSKHVYRRFGDNGEDMIEKVDWKVGY